MDYFTSDYQQCCNISSSQQKLRMEEVPLNKKQKWYPFLKNIMRINNMKKFLSIASQHFLNPN